MGPWKLAWRQLRRHRMAVWAGRVLVAMYAVMLLDGVLCPYDFDSQRRDHAYHPPSRLRFVDSQGKFHLRPFVYGTRYAFDEITYERQWAEDTSQVYPLRFFVSGDSSSILLGTVRTRWHLFGVEAPGRLYLLGADYHGRDLFSRLIFAGRVSLTIGLVGTTISMIIGMIVGGLSGYAGGWADNLIQRLCELIMLIPGLYTLMILYNALPAGLSSVQVYFGVVVILAFIGWASLARIIRGMVLSLKTSDFVMAARAGGVGPWRIILRHVLPGTFSYAVVAASLSIPAYILGESGLSLIGMGIQDPVPSWGNMLQAATNIAELTKHPWLLWPGAAIFVTVMAFNFLGDGIRDALDPRMRTS
jgi:peptide/nickel transport system permease protein